MSKDTPITDQADRMVRFQVCTFQHVKSPCDLCRCHVPKNEKIVGVITLDSVDVAYYCRKCYDQVLEWAGGALNMFPKEPAKAMWLFKVPAYLAVAPSPFKLFYPEDPIELGLYRQRMQQACEESSGVQHGGN